jgi:hypothetical protein
VSGIPGYSGQNSSAIRTDLMTDASHMLGAAGNTGAKNFNLGSLGIGNTTFAVPQWVWIAAAALAAVYVWGRVK